MLHYKKTMLLTLCFIFSVTFAADWPQWQGPDRDNMSPDSGLLKTWPAEGPELLWSLQGLGKGYSTVAVVGDTIYLTGVVGKDGVLNAVTIDGTLKWQKPYGLEWTRSYGSTRTTPTIDSGFAYVYTGLGEAVCLDADTGDKKWSVNVIEKFKGKKLHWGMAESLLVADGKVICTPGGSEAVVVALDSGTGETVWQTEGLSSDSSYSSPNLVERGGKKIILSLTTDYLSGIDLETGKVLWKYLCDDYINPDHKSFGRDSMPNTPLYHDGFIYITAGYDMGGAKFELSQDGNSVKKLWTNYDLDTHHGGVILYQGYLYGSGWDGNAKGSWVCVDFNSGKTMYDQSWDDNKGAISYADGMLYCYAEKTGNLALVKPNPEKFEIISSFKVPLGDDEYWPHPVILDGRLYVRHGEALMVYDVKAKP